MNDRIESSVETSSHFSRAIAERSRRIRQDVEAIRIRFVHSSIDIGFTMAHVAACYPKASERRIQYTAVARGAFEKAVRFSRDLSCTPEEAERFRSDLGRLEDSLDELAGDSH